MPCCGPQAPSPSSTAIARSDKDDEMPRIPISSTALLVRRRCCLIFITSTSLPPGPAPPARLTTTPRAPGRARPKGERLGPRWDPPAHAVRSAVQCSGRKEQEHRYPWAGPEREGAVSNRTVGTYSVEGGKSVDRATNDSHAGAASDADQAPSRRPATHHTPCQQRRGGEKRWAPCRYGPRRPGTYTPHCPASTV